IARDHMRTRSLVAEPHSTSLLARGQQAFRTLLRHNIPPPDNVVANRYSNIEPYDRTRVVVGDLKGSHCSVGAEGSKGRYFNASWVRELYGGKLWIATQAPLPRTAHVFPQCHPSLNFPYMHSSSRVRTVKAHAYFPSTPGQSVLSNPDPTSDAPRKVSIVPVTSTNPQDAVVFTHLLYAAWRTMDLIAFVRLGIALTRIPLHPPSSPKPDPDPPIMVHCSAGIGRTGSFIAMSSLLRVYHLLSGNPLSNTLTPPLQPLSPLPVSPLGTLPKELQEDLIAQEIDSLREQRPGMVQRDEHNSSHLRYLKPSV
ncbi:protein-tyrosine phosphatase-like protein, partial [Suillus subaureus]